MARTRQAHAGPRRQPAGGEFIEWARVKGYLTVRKPIQEILAEFFEIDLAKIEAEKRAMITALRTIHETQH